jgi:hypothetical protein
MIKIIDIIRLGIEGQPKKNSQSLSVFTVSLSFLLLKKRKGGREIFGLFLFSECHVGY